MPGDGVCRGDRVSAVSGRTDLLHVTLSPSAPRHPTSERGASTDVNPPKSAEPIPKTTLKTMSTMRMPTRATRPVPMARPVSNSNASRSAVIAAARNQKKTTSPTIQPRMGMIPSTRNSFGACANPMVRSTCPGVTEVCPVEKRLAPT